MGKVKFHNNDGRYLSWVKTRRWNFISQSSIFISSYRWARSRLLTTLSVSAQRCNSVCWMIIRFHEQFVSFILCIKRRSINIELWMMSSPTAATRRSNFLYSQIANPIKTGLFFQTSQSHELMNLQPAGSSF